MVVNAQPIKAEMSVAAPKSQAKEPIQLDMIMVCRKRTDLRCDQRASIDSAIERGCAKINRLRQAGFILSRNDRKVALYGQVLTAIISPDDLTFVDQALDNALTLTAERIPLTDLQPFQPALFE